MNHVVHAHAPNTSDPRHRKNLLATRKQLPALHDLLIADAGESRSRFRTAFVKRRKKLLPIRDLRRLESRAAHGRIVQFLGVNGHRDPFRHCADVPGKPAQRPGLLMRLPTPLVIGHALEHLARVLHFLVKFCQHRLSNSHVGLLCEIEIQRQILGEQKAKCQALSFAAAIIRIVSIPSPRSNQFLVKYR